MTKEEARTWLKQLASETGASFEETDVDDLSRRKPEDLETVKSAFEQQYALRGATGGDRKKGGYDTQREDDPERVWTRGQEGSDEIPGDAGQPLREWEAPDSLEDLPTRIEERIKTLFREFLGRDATPAEISALERSERITDDPNDRSPIRKYHGGWEERLTQYLANSKEYRLGPSDVESTLDERIKALYLKYGLEEPSNREINAHKMNPRGLFGIEHELQLNPSEKYKLDNPIQPFIPAGPVTPAVTATESSWNIPAPGGGGEETEEGDSEDGGTTFNPQPSTSNPQPSTSNPSTMGNLFNPTRNPYSARSPVQPYQLDSRTASLGTPSSPNSFTPQQPYPPGMPASPVYSGTMGQVMSNQPSTPAFSGGDPSSWENYGGYYGRAGQDFQNGPQGWGYNPAPWANTDQLLRGGFGPQGIAGTNRNALSSDVENESDEDRRARKAYAFGRREGLGNQRNADLGNQDFKSQMDRWIQSYNQWNDQGVDPFASPVNGRRGITGTGSSGNTGGS